MTEEQEETRLIWNAIQGSQRLFDLYGYYPTLHDAYVTEIDVNFEQRELSMTFEYSDLVGDKPKYGVDGKSLATKIIMCWNVVSEAKLSMDDNYIYHIGFHQVGDNIRTEFEQAFGIGGHILAESINVVSAEKSKRDSMPKDSRFLHVTTFGFA
jgi:hypothetical protein